MPRWSKTTPTLGEREIFGDEDLAEMRAELEQLAASVTELSAQLHAQFTTIAAHAEIAREQSEFARDEARADLERTRNTLIELVEQVRGTSASHLPPPSPTNLSERQHARIDTVERTVDGLARALDDVRVRQNELADMMAAILDSIVAADRANTPVADLTLA